MSFKFYSKMLLLVGVFGVGSFESGIESAFGQSIVLPSCFVESGDRSEVNIHEVGKGTYCLDGNNRVRKGLRDCKAKDTQGLWNRVFNGRCISKKDWTDQYIAEHGSEVFKRTNSQVVACPNGNSGTCPGAGSGNVNTKVTVDGNGGGSRGGSTSAKDSDEARNSEDNSKPRGAGNKANNAVKVLDKKIEIFDKLCGDSGILDDAAKKRADRIDGLKEEMDEYLLSQCEKDDAGQVDIDNCNNIKLLAALEKNASGTCHTECVALMSKKDTACYYKRLEEYNTALKEKLCPLLSINDFSNDEGILGDGGQNLGKCTSDEKGKNTQDLCIVLTRNSECATLIYGNQGFGDDDVNCKFFQIANRLQDVTNKNNHASNLLKQLKKPPAEGSCKITSVTKAKNAPKIVESYNVSDACISDMEATCQDELAKLISKREDAIANCPTCNLRRQAGDQGAGSCVYTGGCPQRPKTAAEIESDLRYAQYLEIYKRNSNNMLWGAGLGAFASVAGTVGGVITGINNNRTCLNGLNAILGSLNSVGMAYQGGNCGTGGFAQGGFNTGINGGFNPGYNNGGYNPGYNSGYAFNPSAQFNANAQFPNFNYQNSSPGGYNPGAGINSVFANNNYAQVQANLNAQNQYLGMNNYNNPGNYNSNYQAYNGGNYSPQVYAQAGLNIPIPSINFGVTGGVNGNGGGTYIPQQYYYNGGGNGYSGGDITYQNQGPVGPPGTIGCGYSIPCQGSG